MNKGHICVSGIDMQTWRFVRPVFSTGLDRSFALDGNTQVINHFNVVELEFRRYQPASTFHTEDWIINEHLAPRFIRHLTDGEIIVLLNRMATQDLNHALQTKDRSLFIVKAKSIQALWDEISYGKFTVRMNFIDHAENAFSSIPVTDLLTLAFVKYQKQIGNENYSNQLINAFNHNPYRYIRIGLTREFHGQHWKQVTAIITVPDLFNGRSFSDFERKIGGHI
jgi:hypothetical protein